MMRILSCGDLGELGMILGQNVGRSEVLLNQRRLERRRFRFEKGIQMIQMSCLALCSFVKPFCHLWKAELVVFRECEQNRALV